MEPLWEQMRKYCGFDDEASRRVLACAAIVRPHIPSLVDEFYAELDRHEDARAVFSGPDQRARLAKSLALWMEELCTGPHDLAYFEKRLRIGRRHVQIGLPQRFMFGGMAILRAGITRVLGSSDLPDVRNAAESFGRLLDLELAVMLETYAEGRLELAVKAERAAALADALALEERLRGVEKIINRFVADPRAADEIVRGVSEATGFEIVAIARYDAPGKEVRVVALVGIDPAQMEPYREIAADETLSGAVAEQGEAIYLERASADPRMKIAFFRALGIDTYLGLPVRSGNEVLGVLSLASRAHREVAETQRGILQALADHLGTAWKTQMLLAREVDHRRIETVARFSRVLAHEVRNPLNSMSLQAALMRRRMVALPESARQGVESALGAFEQETRRLNELVEHYLLIGKAGQLRRERARLCPLVEGVLEVHAAALAEAGIALELERVDVEVDVDVAKVTQVLHNLVRNAIDAMAGGGKLRVHCEVAGGFAKVLFGDSGPGVSHPESIFDPFFTTKSLGTGLGLPVARDIMRAHGGDLELVSSGRPGAEFLVTIPLA